MGMRKSVAGRGAGAVRSSLACTEGRGSAGKRPERGNLCVPLGVSTWLFTAPRVDVVDALSSWLCTHRSARLSLLIDSV